MECFCFECRTFLYQNSLHGVIAEICIKSKNDKKRPPEKKTVHQFISKCFCWGVVRVKRWKLAVKAGIIHPIHCRLPGVLAVRLLRWLCLLRCDTSPAEILKSRFSHKKGFSRANQRARKRSGCRFPGWCWAGPGVRVPGGGMHGIWLWLKRG